MPVFMLQYSSVYLAILKVYRSKSCNYVNDKYFIKSIVNSVKQSEDHINQHKFLYIYISIILRKCLKKLERSK